MKKFLILTLILAVGLTIFAFAQENEEVKPEEEKKVEIKPEIKPVETKTPFEIKTIEPKPIEIKYKPEKIEVKVPKLTDRQLGPFKKFDEFIREEIAEHPGANYFFLNPANHASQQGVVEQNQNNVLTISSNGFRMNWLVATDTMVIAAQRLSLLAQVNPQADIQSVATGTRVRVFGNWDGSNLIAKRVVALEPRKVIQPVVNELIKKIQEALEKAGVKIDWTPILQQLQQR